jgi:hypothetical protein
MRKIVTIYSLPPRTLAYYDWLLTGLGILQEQGQIELRLVGAWWDKLLRSHPKAMRLAQRLSPNFVNAISPMDAVCVTGKFEIGGKISNFAMDIADSPFVFCTALLETVDVYFKLQCPKTFEPEGFPINRNIRAPYHPDVFTFQSKIRPGMLGRPLSHTPNLRRNLTILKSWEDSPAAKKDIRIFASFGTIDHPPARTRSTPLPAPYNYFSETTLLARYSGAIHHPNQKRARIVQMLRAMGKPDIDARLWRTNDASLYGRPLTEQEYHTYLGRSAWNMNISGLRRSIPYRLCDTILTGGTMITDTLAIRWYQPFEPCEVAEIGDLGYELESDINWASVSESLEKIYASGPQSAETARAIRDCYERKWSPAAFARYFIAECEKALPT